jgi:hypothetical protein
MQAEQLIEAANSSITRAERVIKRAVKVSHPNFHPAGRVVELG